MKYVDTDQTTIDDLSKKRLGDDERFSFRCHSGLECFNRCCRNLNLFLYPYDVIRLKKALEIDSDRFIDQYTDVVMRPGMFFPDVLLRMAENTEKTCPFLTDDGCSVYPDRPYSCRFFPIEQGMLFDAGSKKTNLVHFFRPPDFCRGQYEEQQWTPRTWAEDQQAAKHREMTIRWSELKRMFIDTPWGAEGPEGQKAKMAFMALYNVDRFRDFIFSSSFLNRFKIKSDIKRKIRTNDKELLKLAMQWVNLFVWGIQSKTIKPK